MEASLCQIPFAFLYHDHPGPSGVVWLLCLALLAGAFFPKFFDNDGDMDWRIRLYLGSVGLLGLAPSLFGKGGAMLYPVIFVVVSLVNFWFLMPSLGTRISSEDHQSPLGKELAFYGLLTAGIQAFLQMISLHSVATVSSSLFWLWAVPLILAALLALWRIAFYLLIQRPFDSAGIVHGMLVLLALGFLGRIGVVEHYGVPVPGSFWEAPAYTAEAVAKVEQYGEDGKTGRPFRTRIAVKVGSTFDSYEDSEGRERTTVDREGRVIWIEIAGIKRPIVEQEGTLYMKSQNDSVLVYDKFGKSYRIDDKLDFKDARKP